jgi:prepilin signal peptidase PulO-like enzyme (type II secretory pathway)
LIPFYDNIPVVSYLLLRGRCRFCREPISLRYPIIELLAALFALITFYKYGLTLEALIYYVYIAALLVITFIDIDHQIIPDVISLPGIPLFFLASFGLSQIDYLDSLIGILVGGGSLFLVRKFISGGLDLSSNYQKRGHGWRGYQAAGHDWRGGRVAGGTFYHLCRFSGRDSGRGADYAQIPQWYEAEDPVWTLPGHRRYWIYLFRPATGKVVLSVVELKRVNPSARCPFAGLIY